MKWNEPGRQNLERQSSWQHAKLHSHGKPRRNRRKPWLLSRWTLISASAVPHHRAKLTDLIFVVECSVLAVGLQKDQQFGRHGSLI